MEKAFDRVPRKVMEWAMRKKGLSEVIVRAVMSLYDGAKTRVRVGSAYSEEFEVNVGVHQGSVLSPLLFAIVVDVVTENARRGAVNELLYADDLVIMSEDMEDLKERFWNWKNALESKGLTLSLPRPSIDDLVFSVFTSNFFKLSYKISLIKNRFVTLFFIRFS